MWELLPLPPDAYDSCPGRAFAYAMNSGIVVTGNPGLTTKMLGRRRSG
jgi:hypothetical protein